MKLLLPHTSVRGASIGLVLALGLALGACTGEDAPPRTREPTAQPSPTPTPTAPAPSPTPPPPDPVEGSAEVAVVDTGDRARLGLGGEGDTDQALVETATAAVREALDAFLDSAQNGDPELGLLRGRWLQEDDPELATALETDLTNPDALVREVRYGLAVQAEPGPTLLTATLAVTRRDGSTVRLQLVFDVTGDAPRLQLAGQPHAA